MLVNEDFEPDGVHFGDVQLASRLLLSSSTLPSPAVLGSVASRGRGRGRGRGRCESSVRVQEGKRRKVSRAPELGRESPESIDDDIPKLRISHGALPRKLLYRTASL